MRTIRWAAVTAAVLLLTACGADSSTSDVEVGVPAAEGNATVEEYVGTISEQHAHVDAWLSGWDELGCKSTDLIDYPTCSMSATTGGLRAYAAGLAVNDLTDDTADAYVGDPPAEISELYATTLSAAQDAKEAGEIYISELDCPDDDECAAAFLKIHSTMRVLKDEFSKWAPHY